jgi:lipopolysaccharide export system protein LptA
MSIRTALIGAATLAAAIVPAARAQVDTKSNAPIDITADQAEVLNAQCLAIWRGAAEALQGTTRLRAHTISVYATPKGKDKDGRQTCGGTERIVADGDVYYVTPQQRARGDHAVYSQTADEIVMTGDVVVVQGKDVARGDKLTIKISTHETRMESAAGGAGGTGRVRGVFYPETKTADASQPKP